MSSDTGILLESSGSRLCTSTSCHVKSSVVPVAVAVLFVSVSALPVSLCLLVSNVNDRRLPGHSVFRDRIHYGAKVLELVELIPLDAYATRRKRSIGGCYAT